jgi:predicted secreted protein
MGVVTTEVSKETIVSIFREEKLACWKVINKASSSLNL